MQNKSRNIEECAKHGHKDGDATRAVRQKQPNSLTKRPLNQRSNRNLFTPSRNTRERHPPNRERIHRTRPDPAE